MGHTKNFEHRQLIYAEQPFLEHQVFLNSRASKHLLRYIFAQIFRQFKICPTWFASFSVQLTLTKIIKAFIEFQCVLRLCWPNTAAIL